MAAKKLTEKDELFEELQGEPIKKNQAGSVTLVRMVRDPVYGTPHEAWVHPDEVDNCRCTTGRSRSNNDLHPGRAP